MEHAKTRRRIERRIKMREIFFLRFISSLLKDNENYTLKLSKNQS
jgi:hypothetical protein